MTILALDLGTSTGWATDLGGRIESGVQTFDLKRGESPGMRFVRFNWWLAEFRRGLPGVPSWPNVLVYEMPHLRGGAAATVLAGLATRVEEFGARYGIDYTSVHSATLKKWTTGKGNADKDAMRMAAIGKGWVPPTCTDDDEVDALCLLHYARAELVGSGR